MLPVYLVYMLVLSWAFFDGLARWWGTGSLVAVVVFALCVTLVPGGGMFISAVALYGAYAVWRWDLWQAALLAFPGFALTAAALLAGGVLTLWQTFCSRRSPPHQSHLLDVEEPFAPQRSTRIDNALERETPPKPRPAPPWSGEAISIRARTALKYRPDADSAMERAARLPDRYRHQFFSALDEDPQIDIGGLLDGLETELFKEENPFDSPASNGLYQALLRDGQFEAAEEFKSAGLMLGDKFDPDRAYQIIAKDFSIDANSQLRDIKDRYGMLLTRDENSHVTIDRGALTGLVNKMLYSYTLSREDRETLGEIQVRLYSGALEVGDVIRVQMIARDKGIISGSELPGTAP